MSRQPINAAHDDTLALAPIRYRTRAQRRRHYDAVVVGARAAGAATAMLLARQGATVLDIDRAASGSDTLSTHALMRGAVSQLHRWGLLDEVRAAGAPKISRTTFRYGTEDVVIEMKPEPGGADGLYAPRRTALDPILVRAADAAGAEVRHRTSLLDVSTDSSGRVRGVTIERDGDTEEISTDLLVGADGLRSSVARRLRVPVTRRGRSMSTAVIKYVDGADLRDDEYLWLHDEGHTGGVIPTTDGQWVVFVGMPRERFDAEVRSDVEATFTRVLERLAPEVAAGVRRGTQVGRTRTWPGHVGQFRKAHGPGWALVGDAGYFKDPGAAHGITDAFRDAELLTNAVMTGDFDGYERCRDRLSAPLFDALEDLAGFGWKLDTLPDIHLRLAKAMSDEHRAVTAHLASVQRSTAA